MRKKGQKWTNDMLRNEALKYETIKEFQKGSFNAYLASYRRDSLDDICSHMKKPPHRKKSHCVYLIEIFTSKNELYYYVGQSCELAKRLRKHFRNWKGSNTTVSDFLNKNPIKYKKHHIVKDNLTYKESLELKRETIKDLKNRGVKLLNKELCI